MLAQSIWTKVRAQRVLISCRVREMCLTHFLALTL